MTEAQIRMMEKLNLTEDDFKPKKSETETQLEDLADLVSCMSEMIVGGDSE